MPEALDMSLDDLVQGDNKRGRGRGKGGGKSFGKRKTEGSENGGGADNKGRSKGKREKKEGSNVPDGDKLDMALEDVIEKDFKKGGRKGGNSEGGGKGKSRGKSQGAKGSDWQDRSYNDGYSKGRNKGASKGNRGGQGYDDRGAPPSGAPWNEHDDRDDDGDDSGGKGKGRDSGMSGGRMGSSFLDRAPQRRPRSPPRAGAAPRRASSLGSGNVARVESDGWQRVTQAPIRDAPRRRAAASPEARRSKVTDARSAPTKRRATEDPVDSRSAKSVKVTNIPRDVEMKDIKDAFEQETGRIVRCRVSGSTAWIAFSKPSDAKKAVETFDRGELNGATIGVKLDA